MITEQAIRKIVREELRKAPKAHWVRPGVVTDLTGWTKEQLRLAREAGEIEFKCIKEASPDEKKGKSVYRYNLNSLHPYLIIKQKTI